MELYNNPNFVLILIVVFAYVWSVCPGRKEDE